MSLEAVLAHGDHLGALQAMVGCAHGSSTGISGADILLPCQGDNRAWWQLQHLEGPRPRQRASKGAGDPGLSVKPPHFETSAMNSNVFKHHESIKHS